MRELLAIVRNRPAVVEATITPSVTVILAGLNEADTVGSTLESVWGSYPRMEIIVVDDGSSDGMTQVAREFAKDTRTRSRAAKTRSEEESLRR